MSVTTTNIGPNSACLNYEAGTTSVEMMTAITAWLTQHGWEVHDEVSTVTTVYRALNLDGETYKYMSLSAGTHISVLTYESWNASTHTGTNAVAPAGNSATASGYLYSYTYHAMYAGNLYLFATERYAYLYGVCSNGISGTGFGNFGVIGVSEFTRDFDEDTVELGLPAHALVETYCLSGFCNFQDTNYTGGCHASINAVMLCRTAAGSVGPAASARNRISTPIYSWGYSKSNSNFMNNTSQPYLSGSSIYDSNFPTGNHPLTGKAMAYNMTVNEYAGVSQVARGRLCGLKILSKGIGSPMDMIPIKIQADTYLADKDGTTTDHWILMAGTATGFREARFAIPV